MPKSQTLVPKFGTWDVDDGVPYTMVFERARAEKGGKMVSIDQSDPVSDFYMNYFERRNTDLPCQKVLDGMVLDTVALSDQRGRRQYADMQRQDRGGYGGHAFDPYSNDGGSRHPPNNKFLESSSSFSSTSHHAKQIPLSSSLGNMYGSLGDINRQQISEPSLTYSHTCSSKKMEVNLERGSLPKFGDWDGNDPSSGVDFTTIFDQVRAEKKSQPNQASNAQVQENIYKPDSSHKTSKGFWNMFCCRYLDSS